MSGPHQPSAERLALAQAEAELMLQRERVAEMRRALPPESCADYVFLEADRNVAADGDILTERTLSSLFMTADRTLVIMHFMYGGQQQDACPMCTAWADGYNAIQEHLRDRVDFAVVVSGDLEGFRSLARRRDWHNLRLLSAEGSSFKTDLGSEDDNGNQSPAVSVFTLDSAGEPQHHYTGGAHLAGEHWRGLDLLSPLWHFLDLTPEGRGDWMPQLDYDDV